MAYYDSSVCLSLSIESIVSRYSLSCNGSGYGLCSGLATETILNDPHQLPTWRWNSSCRPQSECFGLSPGIEVLRTKIINCQLCCPVDTVLLASWPYSVWASLLPRVVLSKDSFGTSCSLTGLQRKSKRQPSAVNKWVIDSLVNGFLFLFAYKIEFTNQVTCVTVF